MARLYSDGASGTLLAPITDLDTNIQLNAGQGENFPLPTGNDFSILTLEDALANIELVILDTRTGDNLTVVRGAEGTTPLAFPASTTRCELRVTSSALEGFQQKVDDPITSEFYFEFPPVLANDISLLGEEVNLTRRNLIKMNTSDQVELGQSSNVLAIFGSAVSVLPAASFELTLDLKGLFQQGVGTPHISAISSQDGLVYENDAAIDPWARGAIFTKTAVAQAGIGAFGTPGGDVDYLAMGIGATWWLGANSLFIQSPFDEKYGLNYANGQIWHDGNTDLGREVTGQWVFNGTSDAIRVKQSMLLFAPTVGGSGVLRGYDAADPNTHTQGLAFTATVDVDRLQGSNLQLFGINNPDFPAWTILGSTNGPIHLFGSGLFFNGIAISGSASASIVCDFDTAGTIYHSIGVSSVASIGTGLSRVNFITPFQNSFYGCNVTGAGSSVSQVLIGSIWGAQLATSVEVARMQANTTEDLFAGRMSVTCFGQKA